MFAVCSILSSSVSFGKATVNDNPEGTGIYLHDAQSHFAAIDIEFITNDVGKQVFSSYITYLTANPLTNHFATLVDKPVVIDYGEYPKASNDSLTEKTYWHLHYKAKLLSVAVKDC